MPETSSSMSSYSHLKGELLRIIDEMLTMESIREPAYLWQFHFSISGPETEI